MQQHSTSIGNLFENAGDYLETRIELTKLKATDSVSGFAASAITKLIFCFILAMVLLMGSIGTAFWIGNNLGNIYYGFFLVTAFYVLVLLVLLLFKTKWKAPLHDSIVKSMLK